jgi:hypothetical protein
MSTVYRIVGGDGVAMGDADTIEGLVENAKNAPAGLYRIEQVRVGPNRPEETTRDWGELIKSRKGRIKLKVPPWVD